MNTLFPSAAACLIVALVASASYAESNSESTETIVAATAVNPSADTSDEAELSVAPLSHTVYPDDRPSWIVSEPDLKSSVHSWVVTTSGCESIEQCEAELEALKQAAVALYIRETTGWVCDHDFLDQQWIDDELVQRRYVGDFKQGDRDLHEMAVELQFDANSREKIRLAHQNQEVGERLRASGGLFGLALVGLCCTGGLLSVFSRRYAT
ncbi:hypothetical protein NHH03_27400 [Stieleria sp. TO1_6]|uniref:hypothetical protein n=1 Tax=Stieleria tagensis TaxID=2956795 RepID=UPI00209B0627|nr:hypothetical protein [Stieleria tagensis]MCO8125495.1 hypothetical protein [Stieleria tagensis]